MRHPLRSEPLPSQPDESDRRTATNRSAHASRTSSPAHPAAVSAAGLIAAALIVVILAAALS